MQSFLIIILIIIDRAKHRYDRFELRPLKLIKIPPFFDATEGQDWPDRQRVKILKALRRDTIFLGCKPF